MPKTKISEFSSTPGNNTDIDGINIAEGCAPSGINDAIRELMSQLKDFQAGTAGDSFNGPVGTTTAAAGAFTTLSASGAVTLSGGTANGVPYLNGSKVLTSGSSLVFDGTNLGVGTSSTLGNSTVNAVLGFAARNSGATPGYFQTYNSNAGADLKTWRMGGDSSGNFVLQTVNDAYSSATTRLSLDANGGAALSALSVNGNNISAVNSLGFRNRIINGDMRIDQRNNGASVAVLTNGNPSFSVDRFYCQAQGGGGYSIQQVAVAPQGFTNSILATVTTPDASVTGTDFYTIKQRIEGFNVADLGWGTAAAQPVTLSFWVRSSITGTYTGSLLNSAENRAYPFSYTISAANTFEYKTITIAGDTTGTWVTNNGNGVAVGFSLGVGDTFQAAAGSWVGAREEGATGQTQWISTNGATFYITGVQLEAGTVASPFERRDYGRELAMCQRYFETGSVWGVSYASSGAAIQRCQCPFQAVKRANPTNTVSVVSGSLTAPSFVDSRTNMGWIGFIAASSSLDGLFSYTSSAEL